MTASLLRPSALRYVRDLNETVVSEFTLRLRRLRTHLQRARVAERIQNRNRIIYRSQILSAPTSRLRFAHALQAGQPCRHCIARCRRSDRIGIWRFRSVSHRVSDPGNCGSQIFETAIEREYDCIAIATGCCTMRARFECVCAASAGCARI